MPGFPEPDDREAALNAGAEAAPRPSRIQSLSAPSPPESGGRTRAAETDKRLWIKILNRYRHPSHARSIVEIVVTVVPFALLTAMALFALHYGLWWAVFLVVPAAAFLLRLFMIQHDCGHGSFFRRRGVNDWVGRAIGVLTLTPYDYWRRTHAVHHATSGNLDERGLGDIVTLTVREYRALPVWRRFWYRLYRNPFVMFGLGAGYTFIIKHRLPIGLMGAGVQPWLSTMATNLVIAAIATGLIFAFGWGPFLIVHLSIALIAGAAGVWLFFVQHQFEDTSWEPGSEWDFHQSALHGSSHYDLPGVLRWFTANIGIHHVHHLASRIPFYRLRQVLKENPELYGMGRLTLWRSFRVVRLALWDENLKRMVSFRQGLRTAAAV